MDNLFLILLLFAIFSLIVGVIRPNAFRFLLKNHANRKNIALTSGVFILLFFVALGVTTDTLSQQKTPQGEQPQKQESKTNTKDENVSEIKNDNDSSIIQNRPMQAQNESEPKPETLGETVSQKNAVRKAISYLNYAAFSRNGLIEQLEYDQFPHADAVYGADNSDADWFEQAAKKAESYIEYSAFSRGSLIEQLKYDGFTQAQAEYGADSVGL